MSVTLERFGRVSYRPIGGGASLERTGVLDLLSATSCNIRSPQPPASGSMELWIHMSEGEQQIRVDRANIL